MVYIVNKRWKTLLSQNCTKKIEPDKHILRTLEKIENRNISYILNGTLLENTTENVNINVSIKITTNLEMIVLPNIQIRKKKTHTLD